MTDIESALKQLVETLGLRPPWPEIIGLATAIVAVLPPMADGVRRLFRSSKTDVSVEPSGNDQDQEKIQLLTNDLAREREKNRLSFFDKTYLYLNGVINATLFMALIYIAGRVMAPKFDGGDVALPITTLWPLLSTYLVVGTGMVFLIVGVIRPALRPISMINLGFGISFISQLVFLFVFGGQDLWQLFKLLK